MNISQYIISTSLILTVYNYNSYLKGVLLLVGIDS